MPARRGWISREGSKCRLDPSSRCSGVIAAIPLFALAGVAVADPSDLFVPQVPPHRHFIQTPTGERVPVGPQICERRSCGRPSSSSTSTSTIRSSRVSARSHARPPGRCPGAAQRCRCRDRGHFVDGDVEDREGASARAAPFHAESFESARRVEVASTLDTPTCSRGAARARVAGRRCRLKRMPGTIVVGVDGSELRTRPCAGRRPRPSSATRGSSRCTSGRSSRRHRSASRG